MICQLMNGTQGQYGFGPGQEFDKLAFTRSEAGFIGLNQLSNGLGGGHGWPSE
ncbi:hypothetical protein D3C79_886560 [compost metagenome]